MNKRIRNLIILFTIILGIPFAWYLETIISIEISKQNYINVEKRSPSIEITGIIDFQPAHRDFFFDPDPDEMYKIEHTGKNKAYLVNSFINPINKPFMLDKGNITQDFDGKKVQINGVLVNDDPEYGKPENTYDAIIIVQEVKVLN